MVLIDTPDQLPKKHADVPDEALISIAVWAHLQGVKPETVRSNRVRSEARRKAGTPQAGDMPPSDRMVSKAPMWRMASYRAWLTSRPGKGAGAGRPKGTGRPLGPRKVALPLDCPHCGHVITAADLVQKEQ
ncbi:hypothetical protein [Actinomadura rudentiformis]|uniref:Uncharacterized protein n=1 Tax=Actinomadura rudentiformis TaxID=359158 RepID=A0A6H9YGP6_9ACTN|nr:hypothetical protein [Actinomadura rudentiformis]KAB2344864.1 hypothetical protein F8566_30190 [Actinomadura rudentiformis]